MKESVGSTVMLYVFLILFVVVISIMAVTVNFAVTFQKKNQIISILEKSDGKNYEGNLNKLFKNNAKGWRKVENLSTSYKGYKCEIAEKNVNTENIKGKYFQVVVFVEFSVPLVNKAVYFPINGETSTIAAENTTHTDRPEANYN